MTMQWIGDLQNKEDDKFLQCRTKKPVSVDDQEFIGGFLGHQLLSCGSDRRYWN